ncbi:MAG TPA: helix-hairpin-helix domain-containing protein, partial [Actinomycetota bacterium]|nr:helix-hairpin-helix domain-containing protein [Actinomycetota bacterium]
GARVANAIRRAGGPTRRADLDALNLAETLADGAKVLVPPKGAQPVAAPSPGMPGFSAAPSPGGVGAQIDLNTADQAALEAIPGIGPVKAQAILAYREEIGTFTSVEQLLEVDGIGPATLESVRSYVRV